MKLRIVIRVCMCCKKCRSKAMALAAATCGVESVALDGKYRDEVVVVGECVDSVKLTAALRKKVGRATLLQVSEEPPNPPAAPPNPPAAPPNPPPPPPPPPVTIICHHCCHPVGYRYSYYSCYCNCYCHFH